MRVISKAQYRAELEASRSVPDGRFDYYTAALKLLHLIDPNEAPEGKLDFDAEFAAALYTPATASITIIDRGSETDRQQDVDILAHELVHAAQDRDIGFARLQHGFQTAEQFNALGTVIEGEARWYEYLINLKQRGLGVDDIDWPAHYGKVIATERTGVAESPSPIRPAQVALRYALGASYFTSAYVAGGPLAVRRAFRDRPTATAAFMTPPMQPREPVASLSCSERAVPADFELQFTEHLGGYGAFAFGTRVFEVASDAWQFASELSGDWLALYTSASDQVTLLWTLQFRTATAAEALHEAVRASAFVPALQTTLQGRVVHIFVDGRATLGTEPAFSGWPECREQFDF
jgi:hypothetical protein